MDSFWVVMTDPSTSLLDGSVAAKADRYSVFMSFMRPSADTSASSWRVKCGFASRIMFRIWSGTRQQKRNRLEDHKTVPTYS